jgi:hypothetical protein
MQKARLIMFHKQGASARLRFLKLPYGGVCGFSPIPSLSQVLDHPDTHKLSIHPAQLVKEAEDYLALSSGDLEVVSEYRFFVDVPDGPIQIFLARFTAIDPPLAAARNCEAEFIELPEARNLPQVELELLREVYALVIGD